MHNRISLIGNVGNQPEIRTIGDSKVASISLGVTEKGYTTKDGKKIEDRTTWFRIGLWRGLAEIVEKYVNKGDKLFVEGKMLSREYEKDGVKYTAWKSRQRRLSCLHQRRTETVKILNQPLQQRSKRLKKMIIRCHFSL